MESRPARTLLGLYVGLVFLAGLVCRGVIFYVPHMEGDEILYRVLVSQLEHGHGYTLHGHPILDNHGYFPEQYDHPLFFHPPGGIALFWLLHRLAGGLGFHVAQILCYGIFFASMLLLGREVLRPMTRLQTALLATLAAFTPIMTHVAARHWLDGPLLAFSTAAAAACLYAVRSGRAGPAVGAGVLLGYASLIKLTAVLIVPGLALLAWAVTPPEARGRTVRLLCLVGGIAAMLQLPWEIWQWRLVGSPFPAWAGRPAARMVAANRYVYYLTVQRTPWVYLSLLPRVLWTLAPGLLMVPLCWDERPLRRRALALVAWIGGVVAVNMLLGAIGYSKVLRYLILVTPATVLLFVLLVPAVLRRARAEPPHPERRAAWAVLALGAAAFLCEVAQGIKTPLLDNYDLIFPLIR